MIVMEKISGLTNRIFYDIISALSDKPS